MKCLHLNIYFKLPDNFNGDLNSALTELIKYRECKKPDSNYTVREDLNLYENWWEMVSNSESKLLGDYSLSELVGGFWVDITDGNFDMDQILDKMNSIGYENLSTEEKEYLKRGGE